MKSFSGINLYVHPPLSVNICTRFRRCAAFESTTYEIDCWTVSEAFLRFSSLPYPSVISGGGLPQPFMPGLAFPRFCRRQYPPPPPDIWRHILYRNISWNLLFLFFLKYILFFLLAFFTPFPRGTAVKTSSLERKSRHGPIRKKHWLEIFFSTFKRTTVSGKNWTTENTYGLK